MIKGLQKGRILKSSSNLEYHKKQTLIVKVKIYKILKSIVTVFIGPLYTVYALDKLFMKFLNRF